jgi:hypothetical protein
LLVFACAILLYSQGLGKDFTMPENPLKGRFVFEQKDGEGHALAGIFRR